MKKMKKDKGKKPMTNRLKSKVRGKLAAKGLSAGAATCLLAAVMTGCQTAAPASRSNRADYGGIRIAIHGNNNNAVVDIGDAVTSDASGGGDTQHNTPTQTTDVKPEVALAWGGASAGTGGAKPASGIVGEAMTKLMGIIGGSGAKLSAEEAEAIKDCADDSCK